MKVNVAVVGAGQAGLATSYHLNQAGVDHVVLEAGRVAETWRSRRWDSFCLVTPNWSVRLPGAPYAGPDPDGYMNRDELVDHFLGWADAFKAPVKEGCVVTSLDRDGDRFTLRTDIGDIIARTVVVATGGYQRAHMPRGASDMPAGMTHLLAEEYNNPAELPEGAVLIVGSGQTGCQLAEELHEDGRQVILACGRAPWAPRRFGGHDLVWWIVETGFWSRTLKDLPSPAARLLSNPLATGHGGGRDMHLRTLHAAGIELVGRFAGVTDGIAHFDPDLNALVDAGDGMAAVFKKWVDALCEKRGLEVPWELPPPLRVEPRTEIDLAREGVSTFPVQTDGRSSVDGLYFMGVHFQRKGQSAVLYGVGEDAEVVVQDIVGNRR